MQHYLLFKNTCGRVTLNKNKATIALSQNLKNIKDNSSSFVFAVQELSSEGAN